MQEVTNEDNHVKFGRKKFWFDSMHRQSEIEPEPTIALSLEEPEHL